MNTEQETKIIVSRRQKKNTIMILNGFILPEVPYVVKKVDLNGMPTVVIYEVSMMRCSNCGEDFEGDFYSSLCDKCEEHINRNSEVD